MTPGFTGWGEGDGGAAVGEVEGVEDICEAELADEDADIDDNRNEDVDATAAVVARYRSIRLYPVGAHSGLIFWPDSDAEVGYAAWRVWVRHVEPEVQ